MPEMVYKWKQGARVSANAQSIGEELEAVKAENSGLMKPEHIVSKAQDPNTALHNCFEWNDSQAAKKYREDQARYIVRSISVEIATQGKPITTRAYVAVTTKTGDETHQGYVDIQSAVQNDDWRSQIIGQVVDELSEAKRKLQAYEQVIESFGPAQLKLDDVIGDLVAGKAA